MGARSPDTPARLCPLVLCAFDVTIYRKPLQQQALYINAHHTAQRDAGALDHSNSNHPRVVPACLPLPAVQQSRHVKPAAGHYLSTPPDSFRVTTQGTTAANSHKDWGLPTVAVTCLVAPSTPSKPQQQPSFGAQLGVVAWRKVPAAGGHRNTLYTPLGLVSTMGCQPCTCARGQPCSNARWAKCQRYGTLGEA